MPHQRPRGALRRRLRQAGAVCALASAGLLVAQSAAQAAPAAVKATKTVVMSSPRATIMTASLSQSVKKTAVPVTVNGTKTTYAAPAASAVIQASPTKSLMALNIIAAALAAAFVVEIGRQAERRRARHRRVPLGQFDADNGFGSNAYDTAANRHGRQTGPKTFLDGVLDLKSMSWAVRFNPLSMAFRRLSPG